MSNNSHPSDMLKIYSNNAAFNITACDTYGVITLSDILLVFLLVITSGALL